MNILIAFILGLIQGIAGMLPISAAGLTAAAGALLGYDGIPDMLMTCILHLGTAIVIVMFLWKSVINMIIDFFAVIRDLLINLFTYFRNMGRSVPLEYRRIITGNHRCICVMVIIASIPAGVIGVILRKLASESMGSWLFMGMGFLITAIMLIVTGKVPHKACKLKEEPLRRSVWTGVIKGISLFPGISGIGMTFCSARLSGMSKKTAIRFILLLSVPVNIGAFIYELISESDRLMFDGETVISVLAALLATIVIGRIMVKFALRILKGAGVKNFAFINVAAGIAAIAAHFLAG